MSLLSDSNSEAEELNISNPDESETKNSVRKENYFKKTRDIKVEKENLLSINNVVKRILVEENFKFSLNSNTKFVNIFLWSVQYQQKMTKMKNLLLGYV